MESVDQSRKRLLTALRDALPEDFISGLKFQEQSLSPNAAACCLSTLPIMVFGWIVAILRGLRCSLFFESGLSGPGFENLIRRGRFSTSALPLQKAC